MSPSPPAGSILLFIHIIIGQGPSIAMYGTTRVGVSHFASRKMFAECTFSRGVVVFDYNASVFRVCKNFARRTFSRGVVVFDYQASVFCVCKFFWKTYGTLCGRVVLSLHWRCVIATCKMTVVLVSMSRSLTIETVDRVQYVPVP